MEIDVVKSKTKKIAEKLLNTYHSCAKKGKKCKHVKASIYAKIITLFKSSDNFKEVFYNNTFKQLDGHELTGDRKDQWGLCFEHPCRLIFRLVGEYDKSRTPREYKKIKKIEIIEFTDYH